MRLHPSLVEELGVVAEVFILQGQILHHDLVRIVVHPVRVRTEQHIVLVLFVVVTVAGGEQHWVALDHLPHGRVEEVLGVEKLGTGALPDARQKVGPIDGDHRLCLEATDAVLGDDARAEAECRSRRTVVLVALVALNDA